MSLPADLNRILLEDDWLRRIARRLAGDSHAAEDLAQDAWVAALSRGRADRPWMFGVLRNLRRKQARRAVQEADSHAALVQPDEAPPAADVAGELLLRKCVTEGMLALEEPYRTAVFLRYVQDEKLTAIAGSTGVAVSTVHQRIAHGLEVMRERLDAHYEGERRTWALGLLSLAKPPGLAASLVGGVVVGANVKVLAAAVVVVFGLAWVWSGGTEPLEVQALSAVPVAPHALELAAPQAVTPPRESGRAVVVAPVPAAEPAQTVVVEQQSLLGRVVDIDGEPVGGVEVGYQQPASPLALTDGAGRFELVAFGPDGEAPRLICKRASLLTLHTGILTDGEYLVIVARAVDLVGVVVDSDDQPIAGATLRLDLRRSLFRELGVQRPFESSPARRTVRTDDLGRFELERAFGGEHAGLWVAADGFVDRALEVNGSGEAQLRIVLVRASEERLLEGVVIDDLGAPVFGASVSAGVKIATTDATGGFQLTWTPGTSSSGAPVLRAVEAGHLPAEVALAELLVDQLIVLRLGRPALAIEGTVRDESGEPRPGVVVWATDLTPFGSRSEDAGAARAVWNLTVEALMAGGSEDLGVLTDEHGRFELAGLLERDYELRAYDTATASGGGPWLLGAGTSGATLTLATEPDTVPVAGRIVTGSGVPIDNVWVVPRRSQTFNDGSQPPLLLNAVNGTRTNAAGEFSFPALATRGTTLELQHDSFFIRYFSLADARDLDELLIEQPVLCELQVELRGDPTAADSVEVLDGSGKQLDLIESYGAFVSWGDSAQLVDGKSGVLQVMETARTLVLRKDGVEVQRKRLRLDPSRLTVESL